MRFILATLILFASLFSSANPAQPKSKAKQVTLNYASALWNKNPKVIDTAVLYLRDLETRRIVKIIVEETAPDSSVFVGKYSIDLGAGDEINAQVYIPPQNVIANPKLTDNFNKLMNAGTAREQPTFSRIDKKQIVFEVFDTNEQQERAKQLYDEQTQIQNEKDKVGLLKPVGGEDAAKVAEKAKQDEAFKKLTDAATQREMERLRLEQLELQNAKIEQEKLKKLNKTELAKRKAQANQYVVVGKKNYDQQKFLEASVAFEKAVDLNPNEKDFYFIYGISLYRAEKLDKSMVILRMAPEDPKTTVEKNYFIGLIHFKLKEFDPAIARLSEVSNANHEVMSPSAAFYKGLVLLAQERLEEARTTFEHVADTSKDPRLDKKADEQIELINNLIRAREEAKKKIFLNASVGLMYDSNILFVPDNDSSTGSAADKGGNRVSLGGDASYRMLYTDAYDLSAKGAFTNITSFSDDFVAADPYVLSASLPYNRRGQGYMLTITPAYEYVLLDFDASETLTNVVNSIITKADYLKINRDDWFSTTSAELRLDNSNIPGAAGAGVNNADSYKVTVTRTELRMVDKAKTKSISGTGGLVVNFAEGDEKYYIRYELGGNFSAPIKFIDNTTWNTGLKIYKQDFSKGADDRKDINSVFNVGAAHALNKTWNIVTNLATTSNKSNLDANTYSKYEGMVTLAYNFSQ